MVRQIHLKELTEVPDSVLGYYVKEGDYDELLDEDCDIYLPSGELAFVFRKSIIKSITEDLTEDRYNLWRWFSRKNPSIGRGAASGRLLNTHIHRRFRVGEYQFFYKAWKGKAHWETREELEEFLNLPENRLWDKHNVVIGQLKGLYDEELCRPWDDEIKRIRRKNHNDPRYDECCKLLVKHRSNVWVGNWLDKVRWFDLNDEEKKKLGAKAYKEFVGRESYNEVFSGVVGAMDRQVMVPWCRMTVTVGDKWEEFQGERGFFHEVNDLFKELMPDQWNFLKGIFLDKISDERFNLLGTVFTTITVNKDFQVAYHRDGNNCAGACAAITTMNKGEYDGYEFVFPEFRLGFKIRTGDLLIGDNQKYIHGMLPMSNQSEDAESIWFVFFSRERMAKAESWDCEQCRRSFVFHSKDNLKHKGTGRPKWNGIWQGMWASKEWEEYRKRKDMEHCLSTNHNFT
jgi:hypothetical protein